MPIVDELIALLGYKIDGRGELAEYQRGLDATAEKIKRVGSMIGLLAAAATTAAVGAFTYLGKNVIDVSAKFEGYQATLETLLGSTSKATEALNWVSQFAATTPYEVGQVTEAFVRLKSYGLDPMDGTLRAVGDAASAMNKPLSAGVEAIADAVTGENERLKEFGITASVKGDQVTYSWIQNGKKLHATMAKTGSEVSDFLKKNFEERFPNAMDRQSKTWNGMVSNLSDTWTGFLRKIGDAGFFKAMERNLSRLMDYIQTLNDDGTIDRWAQHLSSIMTVGAEFIGKAAERIGRHLITIAGGIEKFANFISGYKWLGLAIAAWLFPGTAAIGALALVVEDFLTYIEGGDSVIGNFAKSISELTGIDSDQLRTIIEVLAGATGLALAALAIGGFTLALNPLTAALLAFAAAFAGAKAAFEYLDQLKSNMDKKIEGIKAVDNPQAKPGYVEGMGGVYMNGAAIMDPPRPPNLENSMTQDALDWKTMMENAEGNAAKMQGQNGTNAVINDSSNKSVTNNISVPTTVNVQQATQAPAAAGVAVGNAIGQAAIPQASRIEQEPAP